MMKRSLLQALSLLSFITVAACSNSPEVVVKDDDDDGRNNMGGEGAGKGDDDIDLGTGGSDSEDGSGGTNPGPEPGCGDGFLDDGEECDDGDKQSGDGCSSDCEEETGFTCTVVGSPCEECGNGVKESSEECDDGNKQSGDGCDNTCEIEGTFNCDIPGVECYSCGNGILEGIEACDDGNTDDATTTGADGCSADCLSIDASYSCSEEGEPCVLCGNGVKEAGEACDDGNTSSFDGCAFNCSVVEDGYTCSETGGANECKQCGNGFLEWDEVCDDGNTDDATTTGADGCNATCTEEDPGFLCDVPGRPCYECGNGLQEGLISTGEKCDDGPSCADGSRCSVVAPCGDGGACIPRDGDGCSTECVVETDVAWSCPVPGEPCVNCGNGTLEVGNLIAEQCDDGQSCEDGTPCTNQSTCEAIGGLSDVSCSTRSGDGCSIACQLEIGATCDNSVPQNCVFCGDGVIQAANGEVCDDGNRFDKDGCTASCLLEGGGFDCPTGEGNGGPCNDCGNGRIEGSEECDDFNNADLDGCAADCTVEPGWDCQQVGTQLRSTCDICGNGYERLDETCDDGNTTDGDGCSAECTEEPGWNCPEGFAVKCNNCGNGKKEGLETCDDGLGVSGMPEGNDGCSATCTLEPGGSCDTAEPQNCGLCGDGSLDPGEFCDDGNTEDGDGCRADCKAKENGWLCDVGVEPTVCSQCGNGRIDDVLGVPEECDDGNLVSGDGCDACNVESGFSCAQSAVGRSVCDLCGNGFVGPSETCDDGDTVDGNGCDSSCQTEGSWICPSTGGDCYNCGDGILQAIEVCDTGSADDAGCNACVAEVPNYNCATAGLECELCGDGTVDAHELCDDGGNVSGDGCRNDCQRIEPTWICTGTGFGQSTSCTLCGNGILNTAAPGNETCDDGNQSDDDGCSATCQEEGAPFTCLVAGQPCVECGNGVIETGETCDDGNVVESPADGCDSACQTEASWTCGIPGVACNNCGDGIRQGAEQCDDDNSVAGDGCTGCVVDAGWSCEQLSATGVPPGAQCSSLGCGDGAVAGSEECDDGDLMSGDGCSASCTLEDGWVCPATGGNCQVNTCGDNILGGDEQCDDGDTEPGDGCDAMCFIESVCGDGVVGGIDTNADLIPDILEECDNGGLCTNDDTTPCVSDSDCDAGGTCTPRDGDGCDATTCAFEPGAACTGVGLDFDCVTVDADVCGNGVLGNDEECDDGPGTLASPGTAVAGDGCDADCNVESFYECEGEVGTTSDCDPAFQWVAVQGFKVSNVDPAGLHYDPTTRSFVGYKTQNTQNVLELCLDGTILNHPNKTGGKICNPGQEYNTCPTYSSATWPINTLRDYPVPEYTTADGATYDPTSQTWYILDTGNNDRLHRFDLLPTTLGGAVNVLDQVPLNSPRIGDPEFVDASGIAIGDDGRLYVSIQKGGNEDPEIHVFNRDLTLAEPSGFLLSTIATQWTVPGDVTLNGIVSIPGFNLVGIINESETSGENVFRAYNPNGTLYGESTLPGVLFATQDIYGNTMPDPIFGNAGDSMEATTDGSGFIMCTETGSDQCWLFAQTCDQDSDCSSGATCQASQGGARFCAAPGKARDDFAATSRGIDVGVQVLDNDTRSEGTCRDNSFAIKSSTPGTLGGTTYVPTEASDCTEVGKTFPCIIYTPPADGTCNIIDTFEYTVLLGGTDISTTSGVEEDTATVTVTVRCDCGNGEVDPGEQCDPACTGSENGCDPDETAICNAACNLIATCGDGLLAAGEACDDGGNESGDGCSWDCRVEGCGDGDESPLEECDDGNTTSGDGCRSDCTLERCGDARVDPGEACDLGDAENGDGTSGCSATCTIQYVCGDGSQNPGEQCDDGNADDSDDCLSDCTLPVCGDGTQSGSEQCDAGLNNGNGTSGCSWDCLVEACGDGFLNGNEECDDGRNDDGDGCSAACLVEYCGDGIPNNGEDCDDDNADEADSCRSDCTFQDCGDGILDDSGTNVEQCDDNNNNNGDGCNEFCQLEEYCGDGIKNNGEDCDYQDPSETAACSATCEFEVCGNGIVETGEDCDDGAPGAGNDLDGCRDDCTVPRCGDGTPDLALGEQCDDGALVNGDGCNQFCLIEAVCGNGAIDPGEECDEGGVCSEDGVTPCTSDSGCTGTCEPVDTAFCSATCTYVGCGNGVLEMGEECDPSDPELMTACRNNCTIPVCGDAIFDMGEECDLGHPDDGGSNGESGSGCTLLCKSTFVCGNGIREGSEESEQCDDMNNQSGDGCSSLCRWEYCGNGVRDVNTDGDFVEQCDDGNNVSGDGCSSICTNESVCGNGTKEGNEQCDDGNKVDGDGCSKICRREAYCGDGKVDPGEECDPNDPQTSTGCTVNCKKIVVQ